MSHSKKSRFLGRVLPCLMAAVLLLSSVPALAVDDGVEPTYDEAYYAMTDYYGNLTEGSVVKSYTTNGAGSLTDYGQYDEIVNLTDDRTPTTADGKNTFSFSEGETPDHFYFEGKTAQPFEDLPWTLAVHYTLNGVAAKAEDLAGKTGVVEISIDAIPNENASEYAKNNYTLEAMAIFNQDDILSLEAPGAQVQLIGNLRAVLFLGLPGEECHYTIRVGSDAFSFGGMTFLMVPATLSQLQEISALSQRKDALEENYQTLSESLDALLNSMSSISSGLYSAASGLDQLNSARETLAQNQGTLSLQADAVLGDLNALNRSLATLPGHLTQAQKLLDDSQKSVKKLDTALKEIRAEMEDIQKEAKALKQDLVRVAAYSDLSANDLEALGRRVDALGDRLEKLTSLLQSLQTDLSGETLSVDGMSLSQLQDALEQARTLDRIYRSVGGGQALNCHQFTVAMLMVQAAQQGETLTAAAAESQAQALETLVSTVDTKAAELIAQYAQAGTTLTEEEAVNLVLQQLEVQQPGATQNYQSGKELQKVYAAVAGNGPMDEGQFFTAVLYFQGKDLEGAKLLAELLEKLLKGSGGLVENLQELCDLVGYEKGLSGDLAGLLRSTSSAIRDLNSLSAFGKELGESLDDALAAVDGIKDLAEKNLPEMKSTLSDLKSVTENLTSTLSDTTSLLGTVQTVLDSAGKQANSGTKETLSGLSSALRATASGLGKTQGLQTAKDNISGLIEDTWTELTGGSNNMLLMDATADAQSLTDSRNGSPQSIQVLIRTQEIKETEEEQPQQETETTETLTFWQRVGKLFQHIGSAITGIFGK